jgi:quinohemoprotein amine dehydrogenase
MPKHVCDQFDRRFAQHDRRQAGTIGTLPHYWNTHLPKEMDTAASGNPVAANEHRAHSIRISKLLVVLLFVSEMVMRISGQTAAGVVTREEGIAVTDPLVIAKCGTCHPPDARGNLERISWERSTPEGWQEALKKMLLEKRVALSPMEARSVVKYLSSSHGLAPEEAKSVMYYAERRIHDETETTEGTPLAACTKCHQAARPLSWRRSVDDWKQLADTHVQQYGVEPNAAAVAFLAKVAPLRSREWASWSARASAPQLTGRWLVTAHVPGRGTYLGEMQMDSGGAPDEFNTRLTLQSVTDGSTIARTGQILVYGGYAWRGRSRGMNAAISGPDDPSSETREALWLSPDQTRAEGRWFWGQYQEFGFDIELRRASSDVTLLAIDRRSLKIGSKATSIRLIGYNLPSQVTPADLNFGPGVVVRQAFSRGSRELAAAVDVAANAVPGWRDITIRGAVLKHAFAIYDRVDYLKVTPESSLAAFGGPKYARGFGQFEAVGYQRGPDGKSHTSDDLELGPVDATWSMEVFYAVDPSGNDKIGKISPTGLLTPAAESPGINYDIWVIATAVNETKKDGRPLVGKGYVVVTVPEYTFNGRRYVRDLDRWIEEGTW